MKKIMFILLISLQSISIYSMKQEEKPEGPLVNLPLDVLYDIAKEQILSGIAQAKTFAELKQAYNFARFALISKQHDAAVKAAKESLSVKNAYDKKYLTLFLENLQKTNRTYSNFNFIKNGINARNQYGSTALMASIMNADTNTAQYFINNGIDINAQDTGGTTALTIAAQVGNIVIVKLLLEHGANINHQDKYGDTALLNAAHNNRFAIAKFLIEAGADINIKNKHGQSAKAILESKGFFSKRTETQEPMSTSQEKKPKNK